MKVLRGWLQDYVDIKLDNKSLSLKLADLGIEVDGYSSTIDHKIVVGKILKISKHQNADKLKIAIVSDNTGKYNVVCGASNIKVGQVVPFAKVGAKIGDIEITKTKIRGTESEGMICSELELGIGQDHTGIKILPDNYKLGTPLYEYLKSDSVFDLNVTPNRGDVLSHIGVAREISAIQGEKLNKVPTKVEMVPKLTSDIVTVTNNEPKLCKRYFARVIENIVVKESPNWLKKRLIACGATPINNIVDVTNYILLDLGHPLHAFDAKHVNGSIVIRRAQNNEEFVTLDEKVRSLDKDMLVIANADKPIAVAGVMGGKDSEVKDTTKTVILEAAEFDRRSIRKTSKDLSLQTEASYRFERGIDSSGIEQALNKAANLIKKIANGQILSGIVKSGDNPDTVLFKFKYDDIRRLTGLTVLDDEINQILNLLGFKVSNHEVSVPSWRHDITIWQDLAEEVARIVGYDKIKPVKLKFKKKVKSNLEFSFREMVKDSLVSEGFVETKNYSFLSDNDLSDSTLNKSELIEIKNPVQIENKYMRSNIETNLLKTMSKNSSFDPILIFEIGNVFTSDIEHANLAIASAGKGADKAIEFAVDSLKDSLKIGSLNLEARELSRNDLKKYKIKKQNGFILEIEMRKLEKASLLKSSEIYYKKPKPIINFREVSKYPSVTRDLAFIIDKKHNADQTINDIYSVSNQINRVELFDEFINDKIGKGKKNVAFHLYLQDLKKTMVDKEADKIVKDVIKLIENKNMARLRTF